MLKRVGVNGRDIALERGVLRCITDGEHGVED